MTWAQLLEQVREKGAARTRKLSTATVRRTLEAAFELIAADAEAGGRVDVPAFGVFNLRSRKARTVRHPKTRELLTLPAETRIGFKASGKRRNQR